MKGFPRLAAGKGAVIAGAWRPECRGDPLPATGVGIFLVRSATEAVGCNRPRYPLRLAANRVGWALDVLILGSLKRDSTDSSLRWLWPEGQRSTQ